jgi:hypothetical protein
MNPIKIKEIRDAAPYEWDLIWSKCDYATYFHSREWAEVWQNYTNNHLRPSPKIIKFSDDKRALLPLSIQKRKGLIKHYFSSPEGTFGGWISEANLDKEHTELLVDYLINKIGNIEWRLNPFDKSFSLEKNNNNVKRAYYIEDEETHVIDLNIGYEEIYRGWSKWHSSVARKAKKAMNHGIQVKIADNIQDWENYYATYVDSLRRWGNSALSTYEWKLFNDIFIRNSPNVKLWLAVYEDVVIGGALCFYAKKHVAYWHGAAVEQYLKLRPINLVFVELIKDASNKGFSWFDFLPSGGLEGVKAFKKSFNTIILPCPAIYQKTNLIRAFINLKGIMGIQ